MSSFDPAIAVVLAHEGGWVSRDDDPVGGETNFGISELIIGREKLSSLDLRLDPITAGQPGWLKALTVDTAKGLYRRLYWERYGYVRLISQTVATKVFDAAVNMDHPGHEVAHKLAQAAAGFDPDQQDGILGMISVGSINLMDPGDFVSSFTVQLSAYYRAIAAKRPPEYAARWLPVWLKRAAWPNQPAPGGI